MRLRLAYLSRREQEKIPKKRTGAETLTRCLTARVMKGVRAQGAAEC